MDRMSGTSILSEDNLELLEIRKLLWGPTLRNDVFKRWSQGFEFSEYEPSALVQRQGGPCGVIAPIQAYILKIIIMETPEYNLSDLTPDKCEMLLIQALCNILMKCNDTHVRIITVNAEENTLIEQSEEPNIFHESLTVNNLESIDNVKKYYSEHFNLLTNRFGVLLFLYSVLLTKGLDNILSDLSDTSEPLIHNVYGYGSQALINLMLTGQAVPYVWDNEQDVGGLKLRGINRQSEIGFITLMEQMRFCTVGSFYKNPINPVWVLGSETHLTVLFSYEKRLVSPETPCEIARRVFREHDPDGSNFIQSALLQDVLNDLGLVSVPEYVAIMRKKLDPDNYGIILLNYFMDEFFPSEEIRYVPDSFELLHYNGIPGSNYGNHIKYCKGTAILLESDLRICNLTDPFLTCLQTKWPNIDINWNSLRIPSLN